jgi:hypothetical protein
MAVMRCHDKSPDRRLADIDQLIASPKTPSCRQIRKYQQVAFVRAPGRGRTGAPTHSAALAWEIHHEDESHGR